jgi:hypothetical protein
MVRRLLILVVLGAFALPAAAAIAQDLPLPPLPTAVPAPATPEPAPTVAAAPAPTPEPTVARPDGPLPEGTSIRSALRRAWIAGRSSRGAYESGLRAETAARSALHRLHGPRRAGLAAAIGTVSVLAEQERLTSSRLPLAVLTLRANAAAWRLRAMPRAKDRMVFGDAVFEYRPGWGWQHHPLASAGRANALAVPCVKEVRRVEAVRMARVQVRAAAKRVGERFRLRTRRHRARKSHGAPCRPAALRRAMDTLASLATDRGGFRAWEYLFPFGGGGAPWISAMTQGTAAQALSRGADALGEARWLQVAGAALGAFDVPPPSGVRVGGRYAMYSQQPSLDILNGFLQSVIGLHDTARLTGSAHAAKLYAVGERTARAAVPAFDTGAWSLYARGGRESSLGYHRLVTGFLDGLCRRTGRHVYCSTARRFAFYEKEPPRIRPAFPRGARAEEPQTIAFSLSKVSTVRIDTWGARGRLLHQVLSLPRGRHAVAWTPRRHGTVRVRIAATGPEGRTAVVNGTLKVRESWRRINARRARHAAARRAFERHREAVVRAERRALARAHTN